MQKQLAHRIAIALPLVIAFVVNLGVAPLLFVQVLYGQFLYTSSILMGIFWILIVPILIVAYYSAYLYDFRFTQLGSAGPWVAVLAFLLLVVIGFFFSNNMLLMATPEQFGAYFSHKGGTLLSLGQPEFWPRFLHMLFGSLAIGGLFVALLGRFRRTVNPDLAKHAERVGFLWFLVLTTGNILLGFWYLFSLPKEVMLLFMGNHFGATFAFCIALLLVAGALFGAWKKRFWLSFLPCRQPCGGDEFYAELGQERIPQRCIYPRCFAGRTAVLADDLFLCHPAGRNCLSWLVDQKDFRCLSPGAAIEVHLTKLHLNHNYRSQFWKRKTAASLFDRPKTWGNYFA